jgi:internalin A
MDSRGWSTLLLAIVVACGGRSQHEPLADAPDSSQAGSPSRPGSAGGGETGAPPTGTGGAGPDHRDPGPGGVAPSNAGGANGGVDVGDSGAGGVAAEPEPPQPDCDPIVFEDPELELTVRSLVARPTGALTALDVVGLTDLVTPSITSLKGVECLKELTSLDIGSQPPSQVTDLSPLAGLKQLATISLNRNPVASLEPLGKLPSLQELFMVVMPVTLDLAPLAGAPNLRFLSLDRDTIVDLAPLARVPTLTTLNLSMAHVTHPEGIEGARSLRDLNAPGVFQDATPLSKLTQLQRLRIGNGGPVANIAKLSTLVNLRHLDINGTGAGDLSAVSHMPQLVNLLAYGNGIRDVSPLAGLRQLGIVLLINNQISDISALAQNPAFTEGDFVYLENNPLPCAAQAASLEALRSHGAVVSSDCDLASP